MKYLRSKAICERVSISYRTFKNYVSQFKRIDQELFFRISKKESYYRLYQEEEAIRIFSNFNKWKKIKIQENIKSRDKVKGVKGGEKQGKNKKLPIVSDTKREVLKPEPVKVRRSNDVNDQFMSDSEFKTIYDSTDNQQIKDRLPTVGKIMELYSQGLYSLASCCKFQGISYRTFWGWVSRYKEVKYLYKQGKERARMAYKDVALQKLYTSFFRAIEGYKLKEVTTYYKIRVDAEGNETRVPYEERVKIKEIGPSIPAIIFGFLNVDPEEWKRSGFMNKRDEDFDEFRDKIDKMSPEERREYVIEQLRLRGHI